MSTPLKIFLVAVGLAMGITLLVMNAPGPSKTREARNHVKVIYDAANKHLRDTSNPKEFPRRSVGPTPPVGTCCKYPDAKCPANPDLWLDPAWQALGFSVQGPHYYSYEYVLDGPASEGPFTARALGDLDCDGEYATFEMYGTNNPEYNDSTD